MRKAICKSFTVKISGNELNTKSGLFLFLSIHILFLQRTRLLQNRRGFSFYSQIQYSLRSLSMMKSCSCETSVTTDEGASAHVRRLPL